MRARSSLLLGTGALLIAACGVPERDPATTAEARAPSVPSPPAEELCAPLLSGCGCAYQCARGRVREDGHYDVTHDLQDSRVDEASLQRRCFDADGRAYAEAGAPPGATRCMDVFEDLTGCGGECIPSVAYLDCIAAEGRCAPGDAVRDAVRGGAM